MQWILSLKRKLLDLLPSNFLPVEQENAELGDVRKVLERAEKQPEKRQRRTDEQSMVIYSQEQGSSFNTTLMCLSADSLCSNQAVCKEEKALKENLNRLLHQQSDVLIELENSENQPGQKRRAEVRLWLSEVERIKHEFQGMIKDGQDSLSNSKLSSFDKKVHGLIQRGQFPNGLVLVDHECTRLPLSQGMKPVGINFQQNAEQVLRWLQNDEHSIIGVYGMGGVGKTTLLSHIHDQMLQDPNLCGRVYWITVSQNWSVHKLQEDIAKVIGLTSLQESDERKRAAILYDSLATMGQIVLILDDMWKRVSGRNVGIPLESSNCKIILSTRSYEVCREMKCKEFVIKVETLPEGEALDFFVEMLGHYDTLEEEAKEIARDVAKECGGLPLAIATMARCMTEVVDINDWKATLYDLKSARGQVDMEEYVIKILRYSYDRLKNERLQEYFLTCILYGEDERIRKSTLIDLWINEGLLDVGNHDAQVAKGHNILNKLESCCLLESTLDSRGNKCVKMHDLIRDMAIIITKKQPVFIAEAREWLCQVPEKERWSEDLVKVSLINNDIKEIPSSMDIKAPILTVLMLNNNPLRQIPELFFVHMRALTVLDLSNTCIMRVPESVSNLQNLRALLLVDCLKLEYVPSVAKLTKLRKLDLKYCINFNKAPKGLEKLTSIKKVSYIPWDVSDLSGFSKMIEPLTSLSYFRIRIEDRIVRENSNESDDHWRSHSFESLWNQKNLVWIRGGEFGGNKNSCLLPTKLEQLVMNGSTIKERSLGDVLPSLCEATALKRMEIRECAGLEYITGTEQSSSLVCTAQLEHLELGWLPDFRGIGKIRALDSFTHLRVIKIIGCPKMKVVFPITFTGQPLHLPNLESIEMEDCKEVEEIFFESNKTSLSYPFLPNLKELSVWELPKLKVIFPLAEDLQLPKLMVFFPLTEQIHFPNLRKIAVTCCEEVEKIFDSNPKFPLPELVHLVLRKLPKMKVIFPLTEQIHLPNLRKIEVKFCKEVEKIFDSNPNLALPKLEHLYLWGLSKMKVIFPTTEQIHLPNLRTIDVYECEEVEKIFDSNSKLALPNLQNLILIDLPKLGSICNGQLCFTPYVRNCPNLVYPAFHQQSPQESEETIHLNFIDINQPASLPKSDDGKDDDEKTKWGSFLSLQFPFTGDSSPTTSTTNG